MTKLTEQPTNPDFRSAKLELDWQDALAQRYRAEQPFHSTGWDDARDDDGTTEAEAPSLTAPGLLPPNTLRGQLPSSCQSY